MKLRNLLIKRAPGFDKGGPELRDMAAGLNIVSGDNGSGKTTTCRAARALLWPQSAGRRSDVDIIGDWELNAGQGLHVELNHAGLSVSPGALPPVPEAAVADCYTITVDNLFDGSQADKSLAEKLVQEMAGGYDLAKTRGQCAFDLGARHGQNESKALQNARKELMQMQAEQAELQLKEDGLDDLRRQKENASTERENVRILQHSLKYREAKEELTQAQIAVDGFPAEMERVVGDEVKKLKLLRKDLEHQGDLKTNAAETLAESRRNLTSCNFEKETPTQSDIARCEAVARKAEQTESQISTIKGELQSAQNRLQSAATALRKVGPKEALEKLEAQDTDDIAQLYGQTEKVRDQKREIEIRKEALQSAKPDFSSEILSSGMAALRDWLRQTEAPSPLADKTKKIILAGVGLAAIISVALAFLLSPVALITFAPLILIAFFVLRKSETAPDMRGPMQRRYEEANLPRIDKWETQVVMDALAELELLRSESIQFEKNRELIKEKDIKLKRLDDEMRVIDEKWQKLRDALGLSLEYSEFSLVQLSERLAAFHKADDDVRAMNARIDAMQNELAESINSASEYIEGFGGARVDDAVSASAALADLRRRLDTYDRSVREISSAEKSLAAADKRIDELRVRVAVIFTGLGLGQGDEAQLHQRIEMLEDYRKAGKRLRDAQSKEKTMKEFLGDNTDYVDLSQEETETRISEAQSRADRYDEIIDTISKIENRIEDALNERDLENALDRVTQAKEILREKRDQALFAAAGDFLMDELDRQYRQEAQPAVVKEAVRLFADFTHGRYELQTDPAQSSGDDFFRALDTGTGRLLGLRALSRGTRMQLLLAARVAFARHAELGEPIPLFLDEALTNSDPERFRAVAQSLLHLAQNEKRQIIYFTCRPEDARAWELLADEFATQKPAHFNLDELAGRKKAQQSPLPDASDVTQSIPAPDGRSMDEYGRALDVPDFDPGQIFSATHIFHMLDDPKRLFHFLKLNVRLWGQAETLRRYGSGGVIGLDDEWKKMSARADLLKAISEAWFVGRGIPLSAQILRDGGVTDTFFDRVYALSESLDHDAARLLQALSDGQVPRFKSSVVENLKSHFIDKGFLDETPRLSNDEAYARVLAEMRDHVAKDAIGAERIAELFKRYWK